MRILLKFLVALSLLSPIVQAEELALSNFSLFQKTIPEKEFTDEMLSKRLHMLDHHKKMGHVTMGLMTATVVTAIMSKHKVDDNRAKNNGLKTKSDASKMHMHMGVALASLVSYYATAYFALNAPKHEGMEDESSKVWHKKLAWIHGTSMVLAPVLGFLAMKDLEKGKDPEGIAKLHKPIMYAGYSALLGAYLTMTF